MKGYQIIFLSLLLTCMIACKAHKDQRLHDELSETSFIEADLSNELDPQRMVIAFGPAYGLSYECMVDKTSNRVIYSFDYKKVSLGAIIDALKFEVGVEAVIASKGCTLD